MSKLVAIIQCDTVCQDCVGMPCAHAFYNREGMFKDYPEDTQYVAFTCGGCCGIGLARKLENLTHKLKRYGIAKEDVIIHLASCIISDNYHNPPCPHKDYLKAIIERKGFQYKIGTYVSKAATAKREAGIYKEWDE